MKFKGLTKIALAGAAVAVTAGTLATSTYAWYVTNSKASVDGITGATASVAGGNILVAQSLDGANGDIPGNFSTKFSIAQGNILQPLKVTNASGTYSAVNGFIPVTPGTFVAGSNGAPGTLTADATLTSWVDEEGAAITVGTPAFASSSEGTEGDRRYMEFKIWLMSTDDVASTTMTLKVTNTTTTATAPDKQTAYTTVGMGGAHEVGDKFLLNAAEALRIAYIEDDYTFTEVETPDVADIATYYEKASSNGVANGNYVLTTDTALDSNKKYYTKAANATSTDYKIFGVNEVTTTESNTSAEVTFDASTGMDANEYYYGVMGKFAVGTTGTTSYTYSVAAPTLNLPTKNQTGAGYATLALRANEAKKLTFRVWLEGTDAQCFDCCSGQNFSFEIAFEK